jgi:hypothetical protein
MKIDEIVKSRHSRENGNPGKKPARARPFWVPAFAGTTDKWERAVQI